MKTICIVAISTFGLALATAEVCVKGDGLCELEEASLLQQAQHSRSRSRPDSLDNSESTKEGAVLGRGHWVAKEDLWSMDARPSLSLFKSDFPAKCFEEADCTAKSGFDSTSSSDVRSWAKNFGSSFGLDMSGSYNSVSGSISSSMGSDSSGNGQVIDKIVSVQWTSARKCKRLVRTTDCALNPKFVVADFINSIEKLLPIGSPFSADRLSQWKETFIQRYGTHYTIESVHGAMIKAIANSHYTDSVSQECLDSSLCLGLGFVSAKGDGKGDFCYKENQCSSQKNASTNSHVKCIAIGGQINLQSKMCGSSIPAGDQDTFLGGGDLDAGSSVISFKFKPISDFLRNLDPKYEDAAKTLEKAVEFANCRISKEGMQAWRQEGCVCLRKCENGGTLDETDCTCKCRKDDWHGWKGPNCEQTFGSCKEGPGTGNPHAAWECRGSNICASATYQRNCKPTDVCCTTDFGVTCCDFGQSCNCGWSSCNCEGPSGLNFLD